MTTFAKTQFQTLYSYHWRIRTRLLDGAAKLSDADYRSNPGYGHGSIHDMLFHLLRTENNWRLGLETSQRLNGIQPLAYSTLTAIQKGVELEQQAWHTLLDKLSEDEIEGHINLFDQRGEVSEMARWRILTHLILHGMQHHSEVAQMLTAKGQSPGDIDFIFHG
ncbi:MAG TPA: DinB family protein [Anaerolineales bacterium]|jgi:uncharacterized damage-inducible protein DinB